MPTKPSWQKSLSDLITDPAELFTMLELDPALLKGAYQAAQLFPLKVTREFVARMQKGDVHDPLLRQILPLAQNWKTCRVMTAIRCTKQQPILSRFVAQI